MLALESHDPTSTSHLLSWTLNISDNNQNSKNTKVSHIKRNIKRNRSTTKVAMDLNYTFEKLSKRLPCLALVCDSHNCTQKSILVAAKVNQSSISWITLKERQRNLIFTKEKSQWISLEQCNSTSHNSIIKPISELSIPFALGCFSISPV